MNVELEDRVVVLGGGLAGLAAATALAERGVPVDLLEGRGALGGRAQSFRHRRTGDELDTGQHVLMGCYDEMLRLLERLGTRSLVRLQRRLSVELATTTGRRARIACPALPAPLHLAAGLLGHDLLSWSEKMRCVRVMGAARAQERDPALDRISVDDWLCQLGQSANARRCFWTPLTLATLNAEPRDASAALLAVVLARAFLGAGDRSSIGLATVGLSGLHGQRAIDYLRARGGRVRCNEPAAGLEIDGGRIAGVRLRQGRTRPATRVVAALPAPTLRRLLPADWRDVAPFDGLDRFEPSPIVSVHLWLDRRVLDVPFVGFVDSELHWAFDCELTWGSPARGGHLLTLVSSGADELARLDRETVRDRCWEELRAALPEARAARVLDWEVIKERSATFRGRPGLRAHRFGPATPVDGLWVAGDWTATDLPATMEGACASGHAVADQLSPP